MTRYDVRTFCTIVIPPPRSNDRLSALSTMVSSQKGMNGAILTVGESHQGRQLPSVNLNEDSNMGGRSKVRARLAEIRCPGVGAWHCDRGFGSDAIIVWIEEASAPQTAQQRDTLPMQ